MLRKVELDALAESFGDSFYIADPEIFEANWKNFDRSFREYFPLFNIGYSYKTNYLPVFCRSNQRLGGFAEVVSEAELWLARKLGISGDRIILNGPAKSTDAMVWCLSHGSLIQIDSLHDLVTIKRICRQQQIEKCRIMLRCNLGIDRPQVSRFGIDAEDGKISEVLDSLEMCPELEFLGFHCHLPYRDLESFEQRSKALRELLGSIAKRFSPRMLNFGGGFMGQLSPELAKSLNIEQVGLTDYASALYQGLKGVVDFSCTQVFVEPGTSLVADSMTLYGQVKNLNITRGVSTATLSVSRFNLGAVGHSRNIHATSHQRGKDLQNRGGSKSRTRLTGYTCIESDVLHEAFEADLEVGDWLAFPHAGSYSFNMKPPFIDVDPAVLGRTETGWVAYRHRQTFDQMFSLCNLDP